MINSRRSFLKKAAAGSLAAVSLPGIISAAIPELTDDSKKTRLSKGSVIVFQGDSITDAGRNREESGYNSPRALGSGYVMLAAGELLTGNPSLDLRIYNKGISGNKVYQLAERWDKDCLDLKPDVLSILIGVNDFWHKLNGNYNGTVDIYRNDYIALLERTFKALPDVRLVVCEPFAVTGVKAVDAKWFPDFNGYRSAAREIAEKFGARYVPFQKVFDEALKKAPGSYWTTDGVHASLAGAALMAEAWIKVVM